MHDVHPKGWKYYHFSIFSRTLEHLIFRFECLWINLANKAFEIFSLMCIHEYFLKTITKIVPQYQNIIELIGVPLLCRKYAVLMSTVNVNIKSNIMIRLSILIWWSFKCSAFQKLDVAKILHCKYWTVQPLVTGGLFVDRSKRLPFLQHFFFVCVDVSVYLTIMYLVQRQSDVCVRIC